MEAGVVGEFGVEGGGHGASLANGDGRVVFAFGGDHLDAFSDVLDFGGADEDHFDGLGGLEASEKFAFADRAVDLAAVGIAPDADVEGAEAFLLRVFHFTGEKDCAGASTEGGFEADELFEFFESFLAEEFEECAGFAARDDESVDGVELLGLFDEDDFGAELFETAAVGVEIALQGQDSDFHGVAVGLLRTI